MRQAWSDVQWLHNDDGSLLGVCLGFDRCGEHERGIARLQQRFGIPQGTAIGVEGRTITKGAEELIFIKRRATLTAGGKRLSIPIAVLATAPEWEDRAAAIKKYSRNPPSGLYLGRRPEDYSPDRNDIRTAWGHEGFSVSAIGAVAVKNLGEIAEAFGRLDGCISLSGSSNPFGRSGLCLTIASRVPEAVRQSVRAADEAYVRLHEAAEATGLRKALTDAGVRVDVLEPRWFGPGETDLRLFFRAWQRDRHNSGWFTEAELRECLEGRGPVMKAAA